MRVVGVESRRFGVLLGRQCVQGRAVGGECVWRRRRRRRADKRRRRRDARHQSLRRRQRHTSPAPTHRAPPARHTHNSRTSGFFLIRPATPSRGSLSTTTQRQRFAALVGDFSDPPTKQSTRAATRHLVNQQVRGGRESCGIISDMNRSLYSSKKKVE